jgi:DNA-binding NarL/FixJ family response regulator
LAITLYLVRGRVRDDGLSTQGYPQMGTIEFIALKGTGVEARVASGTEAGAAVRAATPASDTRPPQKVTSPPERALEDGRFRDRTSKHCSVLAKHYRLTARETEVMDLLARGNSVARIAQTLIVSENTVRTHSKRLYVKLNIHKRQDLLVLLDQISEAVRQQGD